MSTQMAMLLMPDGDWHHVAVVAGRWYVDGEEAEGVAHPATWTGVDLTPEEVRSIARRALTDEAGS